MTSTHKIKTAYAAFIFGSLLAIGLASALAVGMALTYYDVIMDTE